MTESVHIRIKNESIGELTINQSQLWMSRTASGFDATLQVSLKMSNRPSGRPLPLVSNIHGKVALHQSNQNPLEIGTIWVDEHYRAFTNERQPVMQYGPQWHWKGTFADLAVYENRRDGGAVGLELDLKGEYCYLLPVPNSDNYVRTEPDQLYFDKARLSFPKEVWITGLRSLGVAETVLAEIPLPTSPPSPWDEVWRGLLDARNAYEQGGTTGWKGCIAGVRYALEEWRKIKQEDHGPGWTNPSRSDREARTTPQRIDNLRWDLMQLAHKSVHSSAEDWSREEALLALSTLSCLLNWSKP